LGVVSKARQAGTKRLVALKMIHSGAQAGTAERAGFLAEAEAVARFQHPNIVQIYEVGEHQGQAFLALELADGGTLAQRLAGNPQPGLEAAVLAETLARAIHYAHLRGVVHRDLKPANILLASGGREPPVSDAAVADAPGGSRPPLAGLIPKLSDFGLAKRLDEAVSTQSGVVKGTPGYMAPEQALGRSGDIGPAADVYALGAILYEILTGRPPFVGTNVLDVLRQVCFRDPLPPGRLQPGVPRDLETICLKCLDKDQRKRYASAEALADDLRRFRQGEPIRARPTPPWERLGKWLRRNPVAAALAVACFLALLASGAAGLFYARAQGREADLARQKLKMWEQGSQNLGNAREHLAAGRWTEADHELALGLAALAGEPDLQAGELRQELLRRQEQVRQRLLEQEQRQEQHRQAESRLQAFPAPHHDALFHATLFTGLDLDENRSRTRAAARKALAIYGLDTEADPTAVLEIDRPYLGEAVHASLVNDCYELLLLWAEAEIAPALQDRGGPAGDGRRQARQALVLLERAGRLGRAYAVSTRAYYLRKARYEALSKGERLEAVTAGPPAPREPTNALDWFLEGMERYRAGRFDLAGQACDEALRRQGDHFWARYVQAVCHLRVGRWTDGKAGLTICLHLRPEFTWGRLVRGFAASELGSRQSDPQVRDAEYQSAETDLDAALRQEPEPLGQYVGLVNRGVLNIRRQRWPEAVRDLRSAVQLNAGAFQGYANLAQALQGEEKWEEAVKAFDRSIELAPGLGRLYEGRAQLQLRRGKRALAQADFERAIAREPRDSRSERLVQNLVEVGRLLHQDGAYPAALASYDRALRLRPDLVLTQRFRAETLLELGRTDEAGRALDSYLEVTPTVPAEVYQVRGLIHAGSGELPAAIDRYSAALLLAPRDTATRRLRGWAYLLSDAGPLALADFETCLKEEPASADALAGRGNARVRLKQLDGALEDAQAAEELGPLTYRLLYNLACLYAQARTQVEAGPGRTALAARQAAVCEAHALACLRRALEGLPEEQRPVAWRDQVQADPALAGVRRGPSYFQLAERYGPAKK
jgi:tetratricopeptide (TPR) repeat protein